MVRAELGAGNRDAAVELLERLKARYVSYRCWPPEYLTHFYLDNIQRQFITASAV